MKVVGPSAHEYDRIQLLDGFGLSGIAHPAVVLYATAEHASQFFKHVGHFFLGSFVDRLHIRMTHTGL